MQFGASLWYKLTIATGIFAIGCVLAFYYIIKLNPFKNYVSL
jgi:hypothetical protein